MRLSNRNKKTKSLPLPERTTAQSQSSLRTKMRAATTSSMSSASPDTEGETPPASKNKGKAMGHGSLNGFASCEACRKGKRRCEPSPLVPPDHPDAAKLPCVRCRRFAIECVRVKTTRRKGPAPVDLSAISDAIHGYSRTPDDLDSTSVTGFTDSETVSHHITQTDHVTSPLSSVITPTGLDQFISGPVIENVVNLFFDHIYPLAPCLHRPTFITKLAERKDRSDPTFLALALTVIASTVVQVPLALAKMGKEEVDQLSRTCLRAARSQLSFIWEDPTIPVQLDFVVIAYLESLVHLFLGNNTAHVATTAQAVQLALSMRLNDESSYSGVDCIEGEMRRRMFWLLFQADKSTACLLARPIMLRLEDVNGVRFPVEVDDDLITPAGILTGPPGQISLVTGFNVVTNLSRILNDVLLIQRRKLPRTVDDIILDIQRVDMFHEQVGRTQFEVPDPFKLRTSNDSCAPLTAQGWEQNLYAKFVEFFHSAKDGAYALNSFLVMQGNILVTQHLIRLLLLQTRQTLLSHLAVFTPLNNAQLPAYGESVEDISLELLEGLNWCVSCPTNGANCLNVLSITMTEALLKAYSLMLVRFVGVHLMEASNDPSRGDFRAQKILMQFLSVLSLVEGMYALEP